MPKLLTALVFVTIFFLNLLPVIDTDFGWHYRCGQQLLQGNPCISNTFSYFMAHYHAYNPSFLFDAITALVYDTIGFNGLALLHAFIITAVFYLIYIMSGKKLFAAFMGYALVLFLSWGTLGIGWRSQIVTYGFFVFSYYILSYRSFIGATPKIGVAPFTIRLLIYPLLMLLWVNTHMGYFIGIVLYALYGFDKLILAARKKMKWKSVGIITVIGISSLLATFINPFGWNVYRELYNHAVAPMNTMIAEWVSPNPLQMMLIILTFISVALVQIMRKKTSLFSLLVLSMLCVMALMARRNTPLFYTIALVQLLPHVPKLPKKWGVTPLLIPVVAAIGIVVVVIRVRSVVEFSASWSAYCTKGKTHYPCKVLEEYPEISGNIYVSYEYGGFMIWQKPDSKVFVDGRMSAWNDGSGEYPYQVFLKILQTRPGWNDILRKYHTDYILIGQGTFLDLLLDEKATEYGWEKVYENKSHSVYKNVSSY